MIWGMIAKGVLGGIGGGVAYYDARKNAGMMIKEGELLRAESQFTASQIRDNANRFSQSQKAQYIGSGVEFGGTAILVTQETVRKGNEEAMAVERRGAAEFEKLRMQAKQTKRAGVMGIFQGIIGGASS